MLSRRKDTGGGSGAANKDNKPSTNTKPSDKKRDLDPSTSSTSKSSPGISPRGQKRKSGEDPHDEKGGEYLRRKHNFIRSTILVDYQPDVCKDYKETGFCGFGDSCKFLHDRSDYKHGWQLEQDWVKGQNKRAGAKDTEHKEDSNEKKEDDDAKSKCPVCKEPFNDPVATKCKHQFCERCAEKECIDKCFVCDKPTSSIFKPVKSNPSQADKDPGQP